MWGPFLDEGLLGLTETFVLERVMANYEDIVFFVESIFVIDMCAFCVDVSLFILFFVVDQKGNLI